MAKQNSKENTNEDSSPFHNIKDLHPVVAIGASAGGLQALNELFENLPEKPGYELRDHTTSFTQPRKCSFRIAFCKNKNAGTTGAERNEG